MRHIKKIISVITALALVLSMSGCYWKGKTKYHSEQLILDALEERYGEEFFIRQMAVRSSRGGRPLAAYCSPKDDEEIIFEVEYYEISGLRDTYIPMIVRREMKEKIDTVLAQYYEDFAVEVSVTNLVDGHESGLTNADEASIVTYSEATPEDSITSIFIAINEEEIHDYTEIETALIDCMKAFHYTRTNIKCYFVNTDVISDCKEVLTNNNYDNLEIMTVLSPGKCISEQQYTLYLYYYHGLEPHLWLAEIVDNSGSHIPEHIEIITIER